MTKGWSDSERQRIERQLDRLVESPVFANAVRLTRFLRYLVTALLDGEAGELNQTRIAIDVMGKGADFDPSADSGVRVEAGRLRSKLREYYATVGRDDEVRFDLPKGRYSPVINLCGGLVTTPDPTLPAQDIQFLKTPDATTIAYSTTGEGMTLIKAANWLSHLEFDYVSPVWRHWWTELGRRYRLVRYDERGCGLSDWEVDQFSVEAWVSDLESVVDQVGAEKFALLGISQGASVAISYAVKHPERVSHLVIYGGFPQGRLRRNPTPEQAEEALMLQSLVRLGWGQDNVAFRRTFASLFIPDGSLEAIEAFDALQRVSTSPENAERFVEAFNNIDVLDLAALVQARTLVLHARHEREIPFSQSRLLAATIPGAKLVPLESKNHVLGADEPAWAEFLNEVDRFLASD